MPISQWIRKEVLETPGYTLDAYPECIKLNQNESPYDLPAQLKATVLAELAKRPWNRYPKAEPVALKKKLAQHLDVWPDEILVTNGSNVLIQALILATSVKKKVLTVNPTFSLYGIQTQLFGHKLIEVELAEDFSLPRHAVFAALHQHKPSLVIFPNPNAPTGTLFASELLLEVVKAAKVPVVIDEAYYPFSGESLLDVRRDFENLVLLRTFSKAFSLGGVRLGFMIADVELVREVEKITLPFCVNELSQVVAEKVLDNPHYVGPIVQTICTERQKIFAAMSQIDGVQVFPSHTNFLLFKVENSRAVFNRLLRQGVLVRDVSDGRRLQQCLRVTVGSPEENQVFLAALNKSLTRPRSVPEIDPNLVAPQDIPDVPSES